MQNISYPKISNNRIEHECIEDFDSIPHNKKCELFIKVTRHIKRFEKTTDKALESQHSKAEWIKQRMKEIVDRLQKQIETSKKKP